MEVSHALRSRSDDRQEIWLWSLKIELRGLLLIFISQPVFILPIEKMTNQEKLIPTIILGYLISARNADKWQQRLCQAKLQLTTNHRVTSTAETVLILRTPYDLQTLAILCVYWHSGFWLHNGPPILLFFNIILFADHLWFSDSLPVF